MTPPAVVGLTLNFRDAERTARCVHNLLDEGSAHVLVWDNSEDDGASARALRVVLGQEPRMSLEISPVNLGFATAVNLGMDWIGRHFPGAWVLLINNDARLVSAALTKLANALVNYPQALIAYPKIDHAGQVLGTVYYQRFGGLFSHNPLPGSAPYPSGCCLLIALERASMPFLDVDFFMYGEDVELGWRLGSACMVHVPETLVVHEGTASSGLGSPFYEARMVAAHWLLARKLAHNRFDFALLLLGRTLMLPARALLRAWRYRSLVPLLALWEGGRLAWGDDPVLQRARAAAGSAQE